MKHLINARRIVLFALAFMLSYVSAFAGGEYFQVYLNKKLLFVKHVSEPVDVMNLDKASATDQLVIQYSHCGKRGKDRHIALKNDQGITVKEWAFSDTKEDMVIPAREIAALQRKHGSLTLNYSSAELPKGRALASLKTNIRSLATALPDAAFYAVGRWLI